MNKKILMITVALMATVMLATPVLAIGPWQAEDVNDNENFFEFYGGLINRRGKASGTNVWAVFEDYSVEWKWRDPLGAKGLMNNALVPTTMPDLVLYTTEEYENKWIFLSGKPESGHGMLYWFWYGFTTSSSIASNMENNNPDGLLWMRNNIYNNMP